MTSKSLSDHIAALAGETPQFTGTARVLDATDPLAALLDEIDKTVLPATLLFENVSGTLKVLVTGRRLHMILQGGPDAVLNTPLSPDNAQLVRQAAKTLSDFANGASDLRVTHSAPPKHSTDNADRVSARTLAAALNAEADDPDTPAQVRFAAGMGSSILGAIHLKNRVAGEITGSAADIATLKIALATQLSRFLDARTQTCASHSDPSLTLLADVNGPGLSIGVAIFGQNAILFALPTSELAKATTTFRQVT